jgi:hypothetical protein
MELGRYWNVECMYGALRWRCNSAVVVLQQPYANEAIAVAALSLECALGGCRMEERDATLDA